VRRPANLAREPFRNARAPALLLGATLVALVALTVQHAVIVRRLLPDATSARHAEAAALETEVAQLRADGVALRVPSPDKASLARWIVLKEMVDRRSFAWTALLARLEKTVPPGVRLEAVSPGWEKGQLRLGLRALAHASDDGFELVKALEDQPDFDEVYPLSKSLDTSGDGEYQFELTMLYLPAAAPETEEDEG
jgi:Tfp pilus assembly protein PilN